MDEWHVWYLLDLDEIGDHKALAEEFELRVADDADFELVGGLTGTSAIEARRRRDENGAQLWLVLEESEIVFACWIYPRATPVRAARGGSLELPPGVNSLEDSFTAASHRGRGIAGGAWTAIARELKARGAEVLITKVGVSNAPSRRAVEKAGFLAAAIMHLRLRGGRKRVSMEDLGGDLGPSAMRVKEYLTQTLAGP